MCLLSHPRILLFGPLSYDAGPALKQLWYNVFCLPEKLPEG